MQFVNRIWTWESSTQKTQSYSQRKERRIEESLINNPRISQSLRMSRLWTKRHQTALRPAAKRKESEGVNCRPSHSVQWKWGCSPSGRTILSESYRSKILQASGPIKEQMDGRNWAEDFISTSKSKPLWPSVVFVRVLSPRFEVLP